ncbi:MAG TPA: efflux RND transporter periplasmic adaptor subunit [Terrimicrobiaceae bacterium]|nr:efflux RND transporter periplasmic adaptor subunit [Terrimicrobiaceae bacterium]
MNRSIEANEEPISQPDRSVLRRRVWSLLIAVLVLAAALLFGITGHIRQMRAQEDFAAKMSEISVEFIRVHPSDKPVELILPANIEAVHQTTLFARATGYIANWTADIGDSVKEGQLLAEIAAPDLDQELAQAQHQLQQAQANYEIARVTAVRWEQLWQKQVVSKEENDTDQAAYNAAEATMNADKANVARLMALEAFKNVTAPFDGRVTARLIDIGTLVSAGSGSAGTTLYQIAQTNPLNIFVNVPQSNAPEIHEGLAAKLLVNEYPNRNFEARVTRTAAALDPASRTLNTELQIPNDDGALYSGMYAYVKFTLSDGNGPVILPANAFVFKTEGPQAATLTKDGRIHWQKIQVGRDFGTEMEVLSGLEDGSAVVVNPTDDLTEGLRVLARPAGGAEKTSPPAAGNLHSDPARSPTPALEGNPESSIKHPNTT